MPPLPPPQGMSEADYETIEAAVTETVRGRWFLGEFARRNRTVELRQILDAMARIEGAVTAGQPALPPADPSIRLLMQRIKEIAAQLEIVSSEMRKAGVEHRFSDALDHQARAVAGMMRGPGRGAVPPRPESLRVEAPPPAAPAPAASTSAATTPAASPLVMPPMRMPRADLPAALARPAGAGRASDDLRLAVLSALDGLALAKKLSLFS